MEAIAPERRLAGRYVLERPIATGGMAVVWLATDEVLARPVAVKILRVDLSGDRRFAQRFQTEAVAAARLTHPNIVAVFDTGDEDGVRYIVMEHFRGATLGDIMRAGPQMAPERTIDLIVPVLTALGFAHGEGVLHRDVKPANILVADDGRVKVTDFGIAKAAFAAHDLTRTGTMLGTVRYVSPEQVHGGTLDARSDLYSVGVVLYEALTGRAPFVAETDVATAMMRLTADPVPPRDLRPSVPRPLEAIVLRSMARDPGDRFQSAEAMRAALERLRRAGEPTPPRGTPRVAPPVVRAARRIHPWAALAVLAIAVALAAMAIGFVAIRSNPRTEPGARPHGSSAAVPAGSPIGIREARDYDPEGADHSEHPEDVHLAIDGDPATAWATDHYATDTFGNLKQGVGLWLDLGGGRDVASVSIDTPLDGWTFELRPGPYGTPGPALRDADGSTSFTVRGGHITVNLAAPRTPGLLVWITRLAPDRGQFAAAIGGVTVRSR
jgi:hypothetical protein